jgi:ribosomal protein L31
MKFPKIHPHAFKQVIKQSDGGTFSIRTTSPRAMLTLTKDTSNHPLWNDTGIVLDDTSGQLSLFSNRFGDLDFSGLVQEKDIPEGKKKKEKKK